MIIYRDFWCGYNVVELAIRIFFQRSSPVGSTVSVAAEISRVYAQQLCKETTLGTTRCGCSGREKGNWFGVCSLKIWRNHLSGSPVRTHKDIRIMSGDELPPWKVPKPWGLKPWGCPHLSCCWNLHPGSRWMVDGMYFKKIPASLLSSSSSYYVFLHQNYFCCSSYIFFFIFITSLPAGIPSCLSNCSKMHTASGAVAHPFPGTSTLLDLLLGPLPFPVAWIPIVGFLTHNRQQTNIISGLTRFFMNSLK